MGIVLDLRFRRIRIEIMSVIATVAGSLQHKDTSRKLTFKQQKTGIFET